MASTQPHRIKTISEFHQFRNLPKPPRHPLISVYNFKDLKKQILYKKILYENTSIIGFSHLKIELSSLIPAI